MKKCENGCCSFNDAWKDDEIYCAAKAPEEKSVVVEKQLNQYPVKKRGDV